MDPILEFFRQEQQGKLARFRILNESVKKGETLFTGSSLMEQFPINELLMTAGMNQVIYNRGIGGFTTDDMLANMEEQVFGTAPSRIFINIGTNDFNDVTASLDDVLTKMLLNYEKILDEIKLRLPECQVTLLAYYPVNEVDKVPEAEYGKAMFVHRNNKNLPKINAAVEALAERKGYRFINVNDGLTDERGLLKAEYTIEGVHMYANGYRVVFENLKQYL